MTYRRLEKNARSPDITITTSMNPDGPLNNYAYYIYGIGHHTEGRLPGQTMPSCRYNRPLLRSCLRLYRKRRDVRTCRPLRMFL